LEGNVLDLIEILPEICLEILRKNMENLRIFDATTHSVGPKET
jgi:hypothetical protein